MVSNNLFLTTKHGAVTNEAIVAFRDPDTNQLKKYKATVYSSEKHGPLPAYLEHIASHPDLVLYYVEKDSTAFPTSYCKIGTYNKGDELISIGMKGAHRDIYVSTSPSRLISLPLYFKQVGHEKIVDTRITWGNVFGEITSIQPNSSGTFTLKVKTDHDQNLTLLLSEDNVVREMSNGRQTYPNVMAVTSNLEATDHLVCNVDAAKPTFSGSFVFNSEGLLVAIHAGARTAGVGHVLYKVDVPFKSTWVLDYLDFQHGGDIVSFLDHKDLMFFKKSI